MARRIRMSTHAAIIGELWDCPGLVDTLTLSPEVVLMPNSRPPCSPEFRRQRVDLVRAGRSAKDLAREFEPTAQSIGAWVAAAVKQEGRREETIPDLAAVERDILSKAVGWFARVQAAERI